MPGAWRLRINIIDYDDIAACRLQPASKYFNRANFDIFMADA